MLFAQIRFHDTVSRGRLLNRFGKDFEGIDSNLSDNFGRSVMYFMSVITTVISITYVGGPGFFVGVLVLGVIYYNVAKVYGQCSRDMRRLDSVSRSPLYLIYGETISGVPILRAFGAGSKFMRDMLACVDTNTNPYYWLWGVNRWISTRFNLLSSALIGITGIVALLNPRVDASLAGFTLAFASTVTMDLLFMVRRFVGLEQSMVAVERVKEYSELVKEGAEFVEPRPPKSWPSEGSVECDNLVIRYAVSSELLFFFSPKLIYFKARFAQCLAQHLVQGQSRRKGRHPWADWERKEHPCSILLPLCGGDRGPHSCGWEGYCEDWTDGPEESTDDHPT